MFTISQASLKGGNDRRGVGGGGDERDLSGPYKSISRTTDYFQLPSYLSQAPRFRHSTLSQVYFIFNFPIIFFLPVSTTMSSVAAAANIFARPQRCMLDCFISIIASSGRLSSAPLLPAPLHLSPPPPSEQRRRHTTCHLCKKATLLIEIVLCRD